MANYKVYRKGNYIIVEDSANKYWEEIAANTKISKEFVDSTDYTITFKDVKETWTVPFAEIKKIDGTDYTDVATWETWYTTNTGFNAATPESVAGILASLSGKQDLLVSGQNIKTINGASILGSGNLVIAGGTGGAGDMTMAVYDPDGDGVVDAAELIPVVVRNPSTTITLRKGTIVYLSGSTGYRPNAYKAQANAELTSSGTFGAVISDIAPNSDGQVASMGTVHDLDTRTLANGNSFPFTNDVLVDGDVVWLDPANAGYVTKTKPQAPNHIVFIGIVARTSPTLGRIVYRISNGFELEELHNVFINGTLADKHSLYYDATTFLWKTNTIAGILGYTPLNGAADVLINGLTVGRGISGSANNAILGINAGAGVGGGINTYVGTNAGRFNTSSGNVGIGYNAGGYYGSSTLNLSSSSNCIFIGNQSAASANGVTNEIVIGSQTIGKGSDTAVIGSDSLAHTYLKGVLHVSNNAYTLPSVAPAVGQVLGYGSAGVSTWVTNSGSSTTDIYALKPNYVYRGIVINNNSTTIGLEGGVTMSTSASIVAQAVINTTFASKHIKARYYGSTVSAGRYSGTRGTSQLWFLGAGFLYTCDFNISDTAYGATCQQFYGMQGSVQDLAYGGASLLAVNSIVNCIGVGSDAADTNLQIFHNDATGTCTKVDLGVDFPANRTSGAISTTVYSVFIYNAPGSTNVNVKVTNAETGVSVENTITTNLPLSSLGLNFYASRAMGAGVTNTGQFDLSKLGVYSIL